MRPNSILANLRFRLMIFALLVILPGYLLFLVNYLEQRRELVDDARQEAQRMVEEIAVAQNRILLDTRALLSVLAEVPQIYRLDVDECNELVANLFDSPTAYAFMGVATDQGDILCSFPRPEHSVNVMDRDYFRRAIDSGELTVSEYLVGRASNRPAVTMAYPVLDREGVAPVVVIASIDLSWLESQIVDFELAPGASVVVIDRGGGILFHSSDGEQWQGRPSDELAEAGLLPSFEGADAPVGVSQVRGSDGVIRLIALAPLAPSLGEPAGYVTVGIPMDHAFAEANTVRNRSFTWLIVSTLLALALAWFGGDLLIRNRIRQLRSVTRRLSRGDLAARTGLGAEHDELGELGLAFDEMADALQRHAAEQARAEDALRQYAERLQAMVHIGGILNENLVLEDIVKTVCEATAQAMRVEAVSLSLYDAEQMQFVHAADVGLPPTYAKAVRPTSLKEVESLAQMTFQDMANKDPNLIVRHDVQATPSGPNVDVYRRYDIRTLVSVVLIHGDDSIGRLNLHTVGEARHFDADELSLLRGLANQAAQALANARLYAKLHSALEQTRHQRQQLEDVLNSVPEGILLLDRTQRIELANDTGLACLPILGDAQLGEVMVQFGETPLGSLLAQATKGPWLDVSVSASNRVFEFAARPLNADAEQLGWVVVFNDVTEEHARQARLRGQERMASVGQLAAGIAHDFNNILTPVLIYVDLLLKSAEEGSLARKALLEIHTATHRAKDLIAHILTFSRQEGTGEQKPVQLQSLVEETLQLVRAALPATIEIHQELDPVTGPVLAHATQIHQMLMNLCTNAGHAMRESGGTLTVTLTTVEIEAGMSAPELDLGAGVYAKLTVGDTGHGIDQAIIPRIFEPFFTTKPVGEGTGMGLAVVHGIVHSHHGAITVNSRPGTGSEFIIYLPVANTPLADGTVDPGQSTSGTEAILVVDDEPSIVEVVTGVLESLGYSATGLCDPQEALKMVRSEPHRFDLVISDVTMPNLPGNVLAGELYNLRPDLPILLVSGYNENSALRLETLPGVSGYLHKPFSVDDLNQAIRAALDEPEKRTAHD